MSVTHDELSRRASASRRLLWRTVQETHRFTPADVDWGLIEALAECTIEDGRVFFAGARQVIEEVMDQMNPLDREHTRALLYIYLGIVIQAMLQEIPHEPDTNPTAAP